MWTGAPEAKNFALIVEDPDAPLGKPVVHWAAWNIPGSLGGLPAAIKPGPHVAEVEGMVQGLNARGEHGYRGPKPPPGDEPHHYHFQLFALDAEFDLPATASLEALVEALNQHTIASCDLVGLYEEDADPVAPAEVRQEPRAFAGDEGARLDQDDEDGRARPATQSAVSSGSAGT